MLNHLKIDKLVDYLSQHSQDEISQMLQNVAATLPLQFAPRQATAISAAVLIPVINHQDNPSILLTQRTSHLRHHAGQISFPGGRIDAQDKDAMACALRETQEEIGLSQEEIQIIGNLGVWPSYSGYSVTPLVGLITPPFKITLSQEEVEEVFEIPLSQALDLSNYEKISRNTPIAHQYYQMMYQNRKIWGFTAGILVLLGSSLKFI